MKPSIGRTVHFVLDSGPNKGEDRPAVIVRVWTDELVNLQVITDGPNDGLDAIVWKTSIQFSEDTSKTPTWHWPERED